MIYKRLIIIGICSAYIASLGMIFAMDTGTLIRKYDAALSLVLLEQRSKPALFRRSPINRLVALRHQGCASKEEKKIVEKALQNIKQEKEKKRETVQQQEARMKRKAVIDQKRRQHVSNVLMPKVRRWGNDCKGQVAEIQEGLKNNRFYEPCMLETQAKACLLKKLLAENSGAIDYRDYFELNSVVDDVEECRKLYDEKQKLNKHS